MKLRDLDTELSNKIGDPVTNNDDGNIFTQAHRIILLKNAYLRLTRTLNSLMRNYAPQFAKTKVYKKVLLTGESRKGKEIEIVEKKGNKEIKVTFEKISELYVKIAGKDKVIPAQEIKSFQYLTVKYGNNDIYVPSIEQDRIYYTVLNGKIYLLPESEEEIYDYIEIVYKSTQVLFEDLEDEVEIASEYKDLLLELAANEAMMDIGRQDKYQLYTSDINNQYQILSQYAQLIEAKEGSDVNDR